MSEVPVSDHEFLLLRRLVYQQTGIALGPSKRALMEARLGGRLRELGLPSFFSYYRYLCSADLSREELQKLVDCITTNTTSFFREVEHFAFLADKVLPPYRLRALQQGTARLRLWSAGCSTGQEAYSLAAVVQSVFTGDPRIDAKILATDISSRAIAVAKAARYMAANAMIPPAWRGSFELRGGGEHRYMTVAKPVRDLVVVRLLNLLAPHYPFRGPFDVIFCRNVLIYFDELTRRRLLGRLMQLLTAGGYLFLGLSEGLPCLPDGLSAVGPSIYRRNEVRR